MTDIQFIENDTKVKFTKQLWHETEILLARCFGFYVEEAVVTPSVTATIAATSKKALYEFIRLSFKNFSESLGEEARKNAFYAKLDQIYAFYASHVDSIMRSLPYYDRLMVHQREGIIESFFRKDNFLAFEMGLGKTLTAASISRVCQVPRTVVVCPSAVKWNWLRDLTKFGFNELYFTMLDATKRRTFRALQERFVIINYDILSKFSEELCSSPVGHFIFDEAHKLKNHLSGRSRHMTEIVSKFPDARITYLSGTPIANRVNDVFSYLKLSGHELGKNHSKFLKEYTIVSSNRGGDRVTGGRNLQDLHIKLCNFMIRRTKEECLDLPEKAYFNYRYELDDYRDEYNKIIAEMAAQKEIRAISSNLHSLNIITSKAKIKGIVEIANTIRGEGRKVVIFGGYKEPLSILEKEFGNSCVKIDGSVESFMRDQLIQRFLNDPECTVFLGNYDAAGVGINLVNASDIIFFSFPFTPAQLYQAIDRLHRIGQKNHVNIHYTFCDDSIDEHIYNIIVDKEQDINVVIDQGKEVILKENMIEILIKKILHREDIHFTSAFSKANALVPGEETAAPEAPQSEVPASGSEHDMSGGAEPQYYMMVHEGSDHLFICNEAQVKQNCNSGCDILFSHADRAKVLIQFRHKRLTWNGTSEESFELNPVVTLPTHGVIVENTPEQQQKLSALQPPEFK